MRKTLLAAAALSVASFASAQSFESLLNDRFAAMSAATLTFKGSFAKSVLTHKDLQAQVQKAVKTASPGIVKVNISAYVSVEMSKADILAAMGMRLPEGVELPPEMTKKERIYRNVGGSGSGFVVEKDAQGRPLIVTNAHVVDLVGRNGKATPEMLRGMEVDVASAAVTVEFADGTEQSASVLGFNHGVDLALIRLNSASSKAAVLKLSDKSVSAGQFVLAIGAPFGLTQSVAFGVVSNASRPVEEGMVDGFIQTDAAVNPGNSGGPLIDMKGQVVGVTNMGLAPTGAQVGVNFAIPVRYVKDLLARYRATGAVNFARAGISLQAQDNGDITIAQLSESAANAGLKVGDIVVSVDGRAFKSAHDLIMYVASKVPGTSAVFVVSRSAQLVTVTVPTTELK